jgi:cytochrome c oxidase subunit 2
MQARRVLVPALSLVLLVLATGPVAAASFDSTTEELIRGLNSWLFAVAVPITLLVEGFLIYAVWKFRDSGEAKETKENRRLEITWTLATMVVLLFVGVASYGVMAQDDVTITQDQAEELMAQEETVVVNAHGIQWLWQFSYPKQDFTAPGDTMVVPRNRTVVITVTAENVIHAFHAPEVGLKADALPGQKNYLKTRFTKEGTYQLYCAEYCGAGHSQMLATIEVVSPEEYEAFVAENTGNTSSTQA